jgi:hypothetical protein
MAEIVNLKRVRKQQARKTKEKNAEANRIKHGVAKPARELAKARTEKAARDIEGHKLTDEHNDES